MSPPPPTFFFHPGPGPPYFRGCRTAAQYLTSAEPRRNLSDDLRVAVWSGASRRRSVSVVLQGHRSREPAFDDSSDEIWKGSTGPIRAKDGPRDCRISGS